MNIIYKFIKILITIFYNFSEILSSFKKIHNFFLLCKQFIITLFILKNNFTFISYNLII